MHLNRQLLKSKTYGSEPFRAARPAKSNLHVPQITIRGDNNLISLGTSGILEVSSGPRAASSPQPVSNGHWPQQILDAIRLKAVKSRRSNDQICELAGRMLGRPVVTLERLSARELARVYEAVCASES